MTKKEFEKELKDLTNKLEESEKSKLEESEKGIYIVGYTMPKNPSTDQNWHPLFDKLHQFIETFVSLSDDDIANLSKDNEQRYSFDYRDKQFGVWYLESQWPQCWIRKLATGSGIIELVRIDPDWGGSGYTVIDKPPARI